MICRSCGNGVVFTDTGWVHVDPAPLCARLVVAWPPPGSDSDEEHEDAA
jgi:hypothetical protein